MNRDFFYVSLLLFFPLRFRPRPTQSQCAGLPPEVNPVFHYPLKHLTGYYPLRGFCYTPCRGAWAEIARRPCEVNLALASANPAQHDFCSQPLLLNRFAYGNRRLTCSTHLGVTCHWKTRCRRQRAFDSSLAAHFRLAGTPEPPSGSAPTQPLPWQDRHTARSGSDSTSESGTASGN